eukprot:EG_transcript_29404
MPLLSSTLRQNPAAPPCPPPQFPPPPNSVPLPLAWLALATDASLSRPVDSEGSHCVPVVCNQLQTPQCHRGSYQVTQLSSPPLDPTRSFIGLQQRVVCRTMDCITLREKLQACRAVPALGAIPNH